MKFQIVGLFILAIASVANSAHIFNNRVASDVNTPGTSPFQAQILNRGSTLCGAVLMSHTRALTAAHCLRGRDATSLIVESRGNKYKIESAITHPNFDGQTLTANIAVLKLALTDGPGDAVLNLGIPPHSATFTDVGKFVGYGTAGTLDRKPIGSQRAVDLPMRSSTICRSAYTEEVFKSDMVCAGGFGSGLCGGDAGSGLTQLDGETKQEILVGIGAFGFDCGSNEYPSVYTSTAYYSDWIKGISSKSSYKCIPMGFYILVIFLFLNRYLF